MNDIFCKIINHEIPSKIVYEDEICIAILDISQTTKGHTLVIPKKHCLNIFDCDPTILSHLIITSQKLGQKIMNNLGAKGFNILTNVNEVGGQTVMHFHIHLIPRYDENDTIKIDFTNNQNFDLEELLNKINS